MRALLIALARFYRGFISPVLPRACRFTPSCSEYAIEALQKHGALRGSGLSLYRIVRCGPWTAGGYDPVPKTAEERCRPTLSDNARAGLRRLRQCLPTTDGLPPETRALYRRSMHELGVHGRTPQWRDRPGVQAHLKTLADARLMTLNAAGEPTAVGPVTLEPTDHRVSHGDVRVYAADALDALRVSSLFGCPTRVESRCAQTGERLALIQDGAAITVAEGAAHPVVAVRWAREEVAAPTIVFIRDLAQADAWARAGDTDDVSMYSLEEVGALSAALREWAVE